MTRTEFVQFRDLVGKRIDTDIGFSEKKNHPSILTTARLPIRNRLNVNAALEIHYNIDDDSKVFVILLAGEGPICRLCIDNGAHGTCPSSHKHGLLTPSCPRENLKKDVHDKSELDGISLESAFLKFCEMANIVHDGKFFAPPQ